MYYCEKCKCNHRITSEKGKSHTEFKTPVIATIDTEKRTTEMNEDFNEKIMNPPGPILLQVPMSYYDPVGVEDKLEKYWDQDIPNFKMQRWDIHHADGRVTQRDFSPIECAQYAKHICLASRKKWTKFKAWKQRHLLNQMGWRD